MTCVLDLACSEEKKNTDRIWGKFLVLYFDSKTKSIRFTTLN